MQLLGGFVIFTENLREICRLLEKLQGFICWKSTCTIALSWRGKKVPPYKWKGDESGFKSCFNHFEFSLRITIDHHGPSIHSGHYTASINFCKTFSISMITQLRSLKLLTAKSPLLHMLYHMNWLKHDFWTRTGGWEFDGSHGAGTSSPSHWQQVGAQAPKPMGCMMCFFLMTFVPVQKLCVNKYIHMLFCMSSVFFGLPIVSCSLIIV